MVAVGRWRAGERQTAKVHVETRARRKGSGGHSGAFAAADDALALRFSHPQRAHGCPQLPVIVVELPHNAGRLPRAAGSHFRKSQENQEGMDNHTCGATRVF